MSFNPFNTVPSLITVSLLNREYVDSERDDYGAGANSLDIKSIAIKFCHVT